MSSTSFITTARLRTTTFKPDSSAASSSRCGPAGSFWPAARSHMISARTAALKSFPTTVRKPGSSKRSEPPQAAGRGLGRVLHDACCRVSRRSLLHLCVLVVFLESEQQGGQSQEKSRGKQQRADGKRDAHAAPGVKRLQGRVVGQERFEVANKGQSIDVGRNAPDAHLD